mmetsp:Transcript_41995/g.48653  ORF Transcript_41995/g.48653 Transcript_41995/m.48653 type:complete len:129 (+) Transcript_41995:3-389(+)
MDSARKKDEEDPIINKSNSKERHADSNPNISLRSEITPEELKRDRIMKIVLFVILIALAITGLILIIVNLVNRDNSNIEDFQETNMFAVTGSQYDLHKVTVQLKNKYKQPTTLNDDKPVCVDAMFGNL